MVVTASRTSRKQDSLPIPVTILIDGQPLIGRLTGKLDLSRVTVGNIERIEIIKRASSCITQTKKLIPGWINVMDPAFNLHLKLPDIHETWMVRKPTVDGWVHSLELFDAGGEMIVQFFGKRRPGIPENQVWKDWVSSL